MLGGFLDSRCSCTGFMVTFTPRATDTVPELAAESVSEKRGPDPRLWVSVTFVGIRSAQAATWLVPLIKTCAHLMCGLQACSSCDVGFGEKNLTLDLNPTHSGPWLLG
jgi:hypothetical protein